MSGQQQEKTRERTPANLGIKFNPALGAANLKRFYATVRALLKSNQESGELALAVLEGRANSSKQSLVQFEPRPVSIFVVICRCRCVPCRCRCVPCRCHGPCRSVACTFGGLPK